MDKRKAGENAQDIAEYGYIMGTSAIKKYVPEIYEYAANFARQISIQVHVFILFGIQILKIYRTLRDALHRDLKVAAYSVTELQFVQEKSCSTAGYYFGGYSDTCKIWNRYQQAVRLPVSTLVALQTELNLKSVSVNILTQTNIFVTSLF